MLIAQRPTLAEEVVDDVRSRFVIEPLGGLWHTRGNRASDPASSFPEPGPSIRSTVSPEFTTIRA